MMNWADQRLTVNQIKAHPFFYGADWNSLRHIEPPFVPHLQSITDTSYFPTDDFGNLPDQLEKVEGVGAEKDLAFLGCVITKFPVFGIHNWFADSPLSGSLVEPKHPDRPRNDLALL
jgi:hypothetical protein